MTDVMTALSSPYHRILTAEGLGLHRRRGGGRGDETLLSAAHLTLDAAEVVAVTGDEGAGKTLLLRALCGLLPPGVERTGTVALTERVVLVPAGGGLLPGETVGEQFAAALSAVGLGRGAALRRAERLLARMHAADPARLLSLHPHQMGEGNRWRVALALGMAALNGGTGTERTGGLFLADAPGAGLDPTVRARLLHLLADWVRETGAAALLAGRAGDGLDGPADRLLALSAATLGPAPEREEATAAPAPSAGAPVLSVRGLRVAVPLTRGGGGPLVVTDAGFDVGRGETLALVGESGSGKAVLLRALARLMPAAAGRALWMGHDLLTLDDGALRAVRGDVQMLFPDPRTALAPALALGAQMVEALAALQPGFTPAEQASRVAAALELAGLPLAATGYYPGRLPAELAAAAGLARALVTGPRLLLADEPFAGLDGGGRERFLERLLRVQQARSLTLVVATADADAACRLAHRVLVMLNGRVVEEADTADLVRDPRHPYTRALLAAAEGHRPALDGDPPGLFAVPSGCPLRRRCPRVRDFCAQAVPEPEPVRPGHRVACHYWDVGGEGA
ncbi:peptide/nickel transport system ATP-binding protein [Azospirillum fermentarium]|uniref:oligopeptide/dipeptide ABC transporter ATP-binding protein n=1 Tax=Azospirillum fermentarium TaxID=1233114 RepID=UPI002225EEE7|nr:oligopeptide/dipeptide ABC transporter ATP-binding protein [Azospirillum fermentarium]MCW2245183.1 peptide/nickel transport system ATP-binding protein [Azospirillum fermentarium]